MPAEQHLFELKSLIYRKANTHDISRTPIQALTLVEEQRLHYEMNFTCSEDILNLLAMTPFAFKATDELLDTLKTKTQFTCQADFLIRLYKKES
jgi:23S rRNA (guanine745-N1)-methyltransferase